MSGVAIVGGGPTGLSAATYTLRADRRTLVFDNGGGTTRDVDTMENVYGFPDGVTGPELVDPGQRHARKYGAEIVEKEVVRIEPTGDSYRVATTDDECNVEGVMLLDRPTTCGFSRTGRRSRPVATSGSASR